MSETQLAILIDSDLRTNGLEVRVSIRDRSETYTGQFMISDGDWKQIGKEQFVAMFESQCRQASRACAEKLWEQGRGKQSRPNLTAFMNEIIPQMELDIKNAVIGTRPADALTAPMSLTDLRKAREMLEDNGPPAKELYEFEERSRRVERIRGMVMDGMPAVDAITQLQKVGMSVGDASRMIEDLIRDRNRGRTSSTQNINGYRFKRIQRAVANNEKDPDEAIRILVDNGADPEEAMKFVSEAMDERQENERLLKQAQDDRVKEMYFSLSINAEEAVKALRDAGRSMDAAKKSLLDWSDSRERLEEIRDQLSDGEISNSKAIDLVENVGMSNEDAIEFVRASVEAREQERRFESKECFQCERMLPPQASMMRGPDLEWRCERCHKRAFGNTEQNIDRGQLRRDVEMGEK